MCSKAKPTKICLSHHLEQHRFKLIPIAVIENSAICSSYLLTVPLSKDGPTKAEALYISSKLANSRMLALKLKKDAMTLRFDCL